MYPYGVGLFPRFLFQTWSWCGRRQIYHSAHSTSLCHAYKAGGGSLTYSLFFRRGYVTKCKKLEEKVMRIKTVLAIAAAVLVLSASAAAEIPIVNPSFEDPALAEDGWTWQDVPGWTPTGGVGIWNTTSADFDPVVATDGQNVLYAEDNVGGTGGVAQILSDTFAADTDYTLTVDVGNSYYYYWAGYSVQLLAGGSVIAEDNDTLWPEYTKWATSTVQYSYDVADAALVGQPLEIRLNYLGLDKDNPGDGLIGVEFDNVMLVPEPATLALLGLGGLLLRRKRS